MIASANGIEKIQLIISIIAVALSVFFWKRSREKEENDKLELKTKQELKNKELVGNINELIKNILDEVLILLTDENIADDSVKKSILNYSQQIEKVIELITKNITVYKNKKIISYLYKLKNIVEFNLYNLKINEVLNYLYNEIDKKDEKDNL